ncbi:hypothetical protein PoB_007474500 [Plakobranchus ocellatus]|uniref:Uncharacterized protein n=1 Tax=Plakobranchus ocellatus TaxID=259542 RepID=A0AAV4DVZ2_9GAST|nr:hypothetical protein PoB_007474500 [Plakobranchus ocellatus]
MDHSTSPGHVRQLPAGIRCYVKAVGRPKARRRKVFAADRLGEIQVLSGLWNHLKDLLTVQVAQQQSEEWQLLQAYCTLRLSSY